MVLIKSNLVLFLWVEGVVPKQLDIYRVDGKEQGSDLARHMVETLLTEA